MIVLLSSVFAVKVRREPALMGLRGWAILWHLTEGSAKIWNRHLQIFHIQPLITAVVFSRGTTPRNAGRGLCWESPPLVCGHIYRVGRAPFSHLTAQHVAAVAQNAAFTVFTLLLQSWESLLSCAELTVAATALWAASVWLNKWALALRDVGWTISTCYSNDAGSILCPCSPCDCKTQLLFCMESFSSSTYV